MSEDSDDIVGINVGGMIFTTTRDTLAKGDTMLSKMFSGKYKYTMDKSNYPFIDRDGKVSSNVHPNHRHFEDISS